MEEAGPLGGGDRQKELEDSGVSSLQGWRAGSPPPASPLKSQQHTHTGLVQVGV